MNRVRRVVAGVDFGGGGAEGAEWVAELFEPELVTLVHAVHFPRLPDFARDALGLDPELEANAHRGALDRVRRLADELSGESGVTAEGEVRSGPPAQELAQAATEHGADLIVLGPHDRRKSGWHPIGSTAARVLHEARLPTLLARGWLRSDPRRVLAAVDDSAAAAHVLEWLDWLIDQLDLEAMALHVVEYPINVYARSLAETRHVAIERQFEDGAQSWLEERLREAGLEGRCEARVALGEPAFEIARLLAAEEIDLLVMGTRGAGSVSRLLVGSVADAMSRRSPCPVLLLPTDD